MKLYDVPKNSKIRLPIKSPDKEIEEMLCTFRHIDGMYSLITTPNGDAVHLGASTEMSLVDGVYELAK